MADLRWRIPVSIYHMSHQKTAKQPSFHEGFMTIGRTATCLPPRLVHLLPTFQGCGPSLLLLSASVAHGSSVQAGYTICTFFTAISVNGCPQHSMH